MSEKKKRILFQVSLVLLACLVIEVVLRLMGYQPGDMRPNWTNFREIDSLQLYHSFYVNHAGLVVADPNDEEQKKLMGPKVNSDGFRSPEFSTQDSTKKKVLFIGDSYTWGYSAEPVSDSSFTDIIRNETDFEVYNTGIPTADPAQYKEIAKKYIPELKPDIVFVMFFMGNDLMKEDRKIIPDSSFFYFTNAGCLQADIDGKHFSTAQAAYDYITHEKYFIGESENIFERLLSKSVLFSRLYSLRFRIQEKRQFEESREDAGITKEYLKGIKQICQQNRAEFKLVLIIEAKEANLRVEKITERYADLLLDNELKNDWLIPQYKKEYFKDYPDAHLNNTGHRFYANYLKDFLNEKLRKTE